MARDWFVQPETERLELFGGEAWIEVKRELSYGEGQRITGMALRSMNTAGNEIGLDFNSYNIGRMSAWIIDWSLTDAKGKQVKVNLDSIRNLAQPVADEIDRVLTAYISAMEAERAEKNAVKQATS